MLLHAKSTDKHIKVKAAWALLYPLPAEVNAGEGGGGVANRHSVVKLNRSKDEKKKSETSGDLQ